MTKELLKLSYLDATDKKGLIAYTKEVRGLDNKMNGKYSISQQRLDSLFSSKVWESLSTKSGHKKYKHVITKSIVEYKNHDNSGGIDPAAAKSILDSVQETLNILGNEIFCYKSRNWKEEPNYEHALKMLENHRTKKSLKDA